MKKTHTLLSVLVALFLLIIAPGLQAQVVKPDSLTHWKRKLLFNINLNQASFSSNWKAGGTNSIGLNARFNYKLTYKHGRNGWENEIDLLYGFVNNAGQGYRKTVDRIFIDTKYGYELSKNWGLFSSLNFISQFAPGYKYEKDANGVEQSILISDFLAPGYITSAWGLEYHPVDYFKVRISPFAPRVTIVRNSERFIPSVDPVKPYGVTPPDQTRFEWLAFQLMAEFNKDIAKNMNLQWRYIMFANYETLALKTIDHRLELLLNAKVNRFIQVGLGGILLYDYDQDSGAQISQAFNLGFAYTFQNYEEPK
ncbi:DUF3078 domain-containing protein [Chryseolinea soli]|uniref:DUF3078 domain-containing protein n=1 Tax=Chryseolinea soli TaxID=2321403 RepID=A0A385SQK8_9BACT|nr:DUF3078 domain-containing protein [Chryseolinea soli]AYB31790.1 DUF3078 domain-containing protein [Chryseolinea soli]